MICPVLDADGVPIRKGDTVYEVEGTGHAYKVVGIRIGDGDPLTPTVVTCDVGDGTSEHFLPSQLTHERPVLDTWERLEEDCAKSDVDYCAERGLLDPSCDTVEGEGSTRHCTDCGCTCGEKMARDLVRRARALAERGQ